MKQIKTFSNSFVLQETDENGRVIFQMGYPKGGLNYLIKNGSIKFFLTEDYFYKNVVWGANIPLVVDGVSYGETALPAALKKIFENVNGSGETITVDTELDEESLNPIANSPVAIKFDEIEAEMADIQSGMVETSAFTAFSASVETELDNKLDASAYTPTDLSNYYTKDETSGATQISEALSGKASQSDLETVSGQVANKQDTLIAGDNITISGNVISATGGGGQITVDSQLSPTSENPVQNKVLYDQLVVSGGSSGFVPYSTSVESFTVPDVHAIKLDTTQTSIDPRGMQFTLRSSSAETGYTVIGSGTWSLQNNEWFLSPGLGDVTFSNDNGIITFNSPSATIGYVWLLFFDKLTTYIEGEGGFTYLKDIVSAHTANTAIHVTAEDKTTWNNKSDFSGSYNDLTDKPTIPTSASQLTNDVGYITEDAISGKADTSAVTEAISAATADYFDGAEYDSGTTRINFYHGDTIKAYIDASAFIVDGMIDDVRIETISGTSYLVIDFNTASGKEDIQIPLTDIFDPDNYYNKTEIDNIVSGINDSIDTKLDTSAFTSYSGAVDSRILEDERVTSAALNVLNTNKLDASAYTPTDLSNYYTKSETNDEITEAVSGKADSSTVSALNDVVTAHTANTAIHVTAEDKTAWNAKSDFSGSYNDLTDKPTIPTSASQLTNDAGYITEDAISGKVDTSAFTSYSGAVNSRLAEDEETTAAALNDLNENKLDASAYTPTDLSQYWTSAQTNSAITAAVSGKQDTLSAGTGIEITDNVISATGGSGGGNPTVELTQAEYDALVSAGTVSANTYYIITDASPADMSQYWTSAQTQSAITSAVSTKQDTLVSGTNIKTINNESILGSGNIDIQGGGKAVSGGTNISITTGATADTINCTLPIKISSTNNTSIIIGNTNQTISSNYSVAEGSGGFIRDTSNTCHKEGIDCKINGYASASHVEGNNCEILANSKYSHAEGNYTKTANESEHASGQYNVSNKASYTFGNSGNTLFSVGNGTADNARHNAFEIRQNGDIYLSLNGQDVKLQDQLGGGSITVDTALDSGSTNPVENRVIYSKIDEVEQVTAAGLNAVNSALGGLKLQQITQSAYDALVTKDASTLYIIVN